MKKAKLKQLLLSTRDLKNQKIAAIKAVAADMVSFRRECTNARKALKAARKHHKEARKKFRRAEKELQAGRAEEKEILKTYGRLERKWQKLSKGRKAVSPKRAPAAKNRRKKSRIKVVPSPEPVAVN